MTDPRSAVRAKIPLLEAEAARQKKELHASFEDEMEDYARRRKVSELPEREMEIVIEGLGRRAIERADDQVKAGDLRVAIEEMCNDPFRSCSGAAERILEKESGTDG